jgi:hypothetical protein
MAYGLKYTREFTNRHDELCRLEFWFKDYTGSNQTVFGSRDSFVLSKELDDPFEPVQAQPAKVELLAESAVNFSVDDFYSEDDEYVLCKFYLSPAGGTGRTEFFSGNATIQFARNGNNNNIYLPEIAGIVAGQQLTVNDTNYSIVSVDNSNRGTTILQVVETVTDTTLVDVDFRIYDILTGKLVYTGFVLQDETADAFIDYDHFIQFALTDNLGLLQDVAFDVACGDTDPYQPFTIAEYFSIILSATGLQLPIQIFANIYETTTVDRSTDAAATFADQTRINSAAFADDHGTWQSCYEILSTILKTFNCFICQRQGAWVVYRWGELRLLDNTPFTGTQFNDDLSGKTAITLPNKPVIISENGLNVLVGGESNVMYKTRPFKYVKDTFDYQQPSHLLKDEDLQDIGTLLSSSSDAKYQYKDYSFPAYFRHETGNSTGTIPDGSFIRISTEIATNTEYERMIVSPFLSHDYKWLSFAPIEVSQGDILDFSCQVKALSASSDPLRVFIRFALFFIDNNGNTVLLELSPFRSTDTTFGKYTWVFEGNIGAQNYRTFLGIPYDITDNITDWNDFSLSGTTADGWTFPPFPFDGLLVVSIDGANNTATGSSLAYVDVATKDISLTIKNRINDSFDINGQVHTHEQAGTIKNKQEDTIKADDSPRLSIAGSLLVDKLTHFNYIEVDAYMQLTKEWGGGFRLGEITTHELKQVYGYLRYKLDCTFIWKDLIDNLTTFQLPVLPGANFRMAMISSINYADCTCKCVLMEIWETGESNVNADYDFKYLYEKS